MATASARVETYTVGDIARRYGLSGSVVRRTLDRIGVARRVGPYRVVLGSDMSKVELAFRARGFLRDDGGEGPR